MAGEELQEGLSNPTSGLVIIIPLFLRRSLITTLNFSCFICLVFTALSIALLWLLSFFGRLLTLFCALGSRFCCRFCVTLLFLFVMWGLADFVDGA